MRELVSNFQWLQHRVSIHSMTGVFRRCDCFQVHLKIQRMTLCWKSTVTRHSILLWIVWCMQFGLKTNTLNRMRHTRWSNLQSARRLGGGKKRDLRWQNYLFRYRWRVNTLWILNGLKKSEHNLRPLWRDTLHGVLQERRGFPDSVWHASDWYWETPRIRMTFLDNGTMNRHSTLGWILQFSNGWGTHFCQCMSENMWSIPSLMKAKHRTRHSCTSPKVINAPCLVHLLLKRPCYLVRCQAKFLLCSGGSYRFL